MTLVTVAVVGLMLGRREQLELGVRILALEGRLAMAGIALCGLRRLLEPLHLQVLLVVELPAELEFVFRRQIEARRFALGAEAGGVFVADAANRAAALDLDEVEARAVAARIRARLVAVAARRQRLELAAGVELMAMRALVALEAI